MSDSQVKPEKDTSALETCVGVSVVLLATFLGICSVKSSNVVQKMQVAQNDRNNFWAWYQARNIREAVYKATADELSVPLPNETTDVTAKREAQAESYRKRAADQETKMLDQKAKAEQAEADYNELGKKDDQFDLCEAALALGLAMMGVTALSKQWWLFFVSLVPSAFGLVMGVAGFLGVDGSGPFRAVIDLLS